MTDEAPKKKGHAEERALSSLWEKIAQVRELTSASKTSSPNDEPRTPTL